MREEFQKVGCLDLICEEKIWLYEEKRNFFCEIDKDSKKISSIAKIENIEYGKRLYQGCEKLGDEIYFSPMAMDKIAIWNVKTHLVEYIPLKEVKEDYKEIYQPDAKCWECFSYEKYVFITGYSYPAIIRIDSETKEVVYITDWLDEVEAEIEIYDLRGYFTNGYVKVGHKVFLACGCCAGILEVDMYSLKSRLIKINTKMTGFGGIAYDGCCLWLVGRGCKENYILKYNRENKEVKEILLMDLEEDLWDPFYRPIIFQKKVYLLPIRAKHIYEISIDSSDIKILDTFNDVLNNTKYRMSEFQIMANWINEDKLCFILGENYKWYEYDFIDKTMNKFDVLLPSGIREQLYKDKVSSLIRPARIIYEEQISVLDYLGGIKNVTSSYKADSSKYGKYIFNQL